MCGHSWLTSCTWQSCTALLKKLSSSKLCSSEFRSNASLIFPKKTLRMKDSPLFIANLQLWYCKTSSLISVHVGFLHETLSPLPCVYRVATFTGWRKDEVSYDFILEYFSILISTLADKQSEFSIYFYAIFFKSLWAKLAYLRIMQPPLHIRAIAP